MLRLYYIYIDIWIRKRVLAEIIDFNDSGGLSNLVQPIVLFIGS